MDLTEAPGERLAWNRPGWYIMAWGLAEFLFVSNPLQISSALRVAVLRLFGASIGSNVIFRPRTRVKFPWKLRIGSGCWIGEGAWLHNQDELIIGDDVVVSQEVFITTGSHAFRRDMALITRPVTINSGVWLTTRVMVLGGTTIGRSAVISPNSVVGPNAHLADNGVYSTQGRLERIGDRFAF